MYDDFHPVLKTNVISQFLFHLQADSLGVHKNSAFGKPPQDLFQAWHFEQSFFVAEDQDMSIHKAGSNWLGSRNALKKPVVIMDHKLNLSQCNKDNTSQKYLIRLLYIGRP